MQIHTDIFLCLSKLRGSRSALGNLQMTFGGVRRGEARQSKDRRSEAIGEALHDETRQHEVKRDESRRD